MSLLRLATGLGGRTGERLIDLAGDEGRRALAVPVLISRLRPPALRVGIVDRPTLVSRLCDTKGTPLVAIIAPGGYGKTTALAHWAARDDRPFAWVSLDPGFDDPAVLITYLAVALAEVVPIDPGVFELLVAPHGLPRKHVLAALGAAIAGSPDPFALVLDDAHLLRDLEGVEILTTLLDHFTLGAQLAIAARWEPALPLGRLRSEGKVTDIGPDDLRLDVGEVRDVMVANGVDVSNRESTGLATRTEGWPVAVYLATRAHKAGRRGQATFSGDDRGLTDYIRSEFIHQLPNDLVGFLVRTSVLDELSGPLCDAVLERTGSAAVLERMEGSNLLLVPLDQQRHWYRYHHLFQETLRAELHRTQPEAIPALQGRASRWFEANGMLESAVRHAQGAGDVDRVGTLLLQHGPRLYARGRDAALRSWFDWLATNGPVDEGVAVFGAWLHLLTGGVAEADRWAQIARAGSSERTLPDGSPVEAWILGLRAAMAGDTARMREDANQALALLAPSSQLRPTAAWLVGAAEFLDGNLVEADVRFAEAAELGASLGGLAAAAVALASRGLIAIDRGRWHEAEALVERASSTVRGGHLEGYASTALTYAVGARVAVHMGDIPAARRQVLAAEQLLPSVSPSIAYMSLVTRLVIAHVHLELGDVRAAAHTLGAAEELLGRGLSFEPLEREALDLRDRLDEARTLAPGGSKLTPAELRLLPLLATQLSFREIAEELFVSRHTVRAQVTSIYLSWASRPARGPSSWPESSECSNREVGEQAQQGGTSGRLRQNRAIDIFHFYPGMGETMTHGINCRPRPQTRLKQYTCIATVRGRTVPRACPTTCANTSPTGRSRTILNPTSSRSWTPCTPAGQS
jgi:LuxR family transcriptional regulator, maltose regulon positive regulatory protein